MKAEKEKLTGKIETLNELVAAVRKDFAEKIKTIENISTENEHLKDSIKNLALQKGSDFVALQAKLKLMEAKLKLIYAFVKIGLLSKTSDDGFTVVIQRKEMIKTSTKSIVLTSESEHLVSECAETLKSFPQSQLLIKVHGFGKPVSTEGEKATTHMAALLKNLFIAKGIDKSSIQVFGVGTGNPPFSKTAVEENRIVEITVDQLSTKN